MSLPGQNTGSLPHSQQQAAVFQRQKQLWNLQQQQLQAQQLQQQQQQQLFQRRKRQHHAASSSDEDDASSLSGSSNCSSGANATDEESRKGSFPPRQRTGAPCAPVAPGAACLGSPLTVGAVKQWAAATLPNRADERQSRRVMRVYMKAVRLLTKMCMVLEDDHVIVCKPEAPAAKKLAKLMIRYDRLLVRLEAMASSRAPAASSASASTAAAAATGVASASVPGGLLQALDDGADPREWIEECVLNPHRKENDKARGLLHALGSYQASILHVLRWEHLEEALPPLHCLRPVQPPASRSPSQPIQLSHESHSAAAPQLAANLGAQQQLQEQQHMQQQMQQPEQTFRKLH